MDDRSRSLTLTCLALAMSVVSLNLVLAFLLLSGSLPLGPALPRPAALALFAAALVLLVASPAVKGAVFKRADAEGFDGDPDRRFAAFRKAYVAAFGMREAAGLLGFVLALLTGNPWWSLGLGAAALISMLYDWPKPRALG